MPAMMFWRRLQRALADALFPPRCLVCRRFFNTPADRHEASTHSNTCWCDDCRRSIKPVESPMCSSCGLPFVSREGPDHLCGHCLEKPPAFDKARAAGIYEGALMQALQRYKYGGKIELAGPLGKLLLDAFLKFWQADEIDTVMPVPLNIRRQRRRGFNQAYLLVRSWPQMMEQMQESAPPFQVDGNLMVRTRDTATQTGLNRRDRRRNVRGAFGLNPAGTVEDRRILLVDDVLTTGATVAECARVLVKNKAARVDVLTLARAL